MITAGEKQACDVINMSLKKACLIGKLNVELPELTDAECYRLGLKFPILKYLEIRASFPRK